MRAKQFEIPQRVWVNAPSTLQPEHRLHGRVGIAVLRVHKSGWQEVRMYFTDGPIHSTQVDPLYLSPKN